VSPVLLIVGIGWMYVVMMMTIAEAISPNGGWLGAAFTFVLYGVLPLSLVLYLLATPARRRARRAREKFSASGPKPDGSGHAASGPIASEREEA
jgi:membrane protein implicated in regulation of membrane protease activity